MRGLITAFRTLTILPVPGPEADSLAGAIPFFPLVGALTGGAVAGVGWIIVRLADGWTSGAAAAMVVAEVVLTGALHLDGLADAADSLGALGDRDKALAIMKDSRIGTFGVAAVGCALLTKFAAYDRLTAQPGTWLAVIPAFAVSRLAMAHLSVFLPYVRAVAGTAEPFVSGARPAHFALAACAAAALCALTAPLGLAVLIVGSGAAWLLARLCGRRYGGVTGDLLGAAGELVLLLALVLGALAAGQLGGWLW